MYGCVCVWVAVTHASCDTARKFVINLELCAHSLACPALFVVVVVLGLEGQAICNLHFANLCMLHASRLHPSPLLGASMNHNRVHMQRVLISLLSLAIAADAAALVFQFGRAQMDYAACQPQPCQHARP